MRTADSTAAIRDAILSCPKILPVGGRSKPCLTRARDVTLLSLKEHSGIIDYEPSEFTFTANAGTTLSETIDTLGEKGQYLPFDPMLASAGATLGGTIAAGLSGPGRFRFGGLRDFLLGCKLVLGNGDVVNVGGKVVKNAAGFDVPKWIIGSLGRLAVISEVTMKVFPRPVATTSAKLFGNDLSEALQVIARLAGSTWELDAIDFVPAESAIWIRVGGPDAANRATLNAISARYPDLEIVAEQPAEAFWSSITELQFAAPEDSVVKVPIRPGDVHELVRASRDLDLTLHCSAAANVAWLALRDADRLAELDRRLKDSGRCGLLIRDPNTGSEPKILLGHMVRTQIEDSLRRAFDPDHRFGESVLQA